MEEKQYLTIRQLARRPDCPISEYSIRKLISEGRLPHIEVSPRKNLIELTEFANWLQSQK